MTKITKKICLTLCLIATLLFSFVAFSMMSASTVKAASNFNMIEGAQLRISGENIEETNGIRFVAEMDAGTYSTVTGANGTFGMIIIPESYRTDYAEEIASAENDYVKAFEGVTLLNIEGITPYEDNGSYRINGVMSNVRYDNMNVSFVGIAYYKIGETYTYVDNHATVPSRSVYQVAMSALYDLKKTYTDAEYAYLDGYKYLAESKASNMAQPDAVAIKAYTDNLKALRSSFDGTTVNFNSDADLSLASLGEYYGANFTNHQINTTNDVSGLKFTATNDGSIKISFPKAIQVYSDSVLSIRLSGKAWWDNKFFIGEYYCGGTYSNSHPICFGEEGYSQYGATWQTIKVNLSEASALISTDKNGNSYIFGLSIVLTNGDTTSPRDFVIDYISVTSQGGALLGEIEGTNYVATYNFDEYDGLITTSDNYSISNGQLTFESLTPYAYTTFKFAQSKTVSEGDYIAIKMGASKDIRIKGKSGADIDLFGYSSDPGSNYIGQDWFNTALTKFSYHNNINNTFTPYADRNWVYLYNANCTIQNVVIPVSYLGYSVNDTIDSIKLASWAESVKLVVDDIAYFSTADFKDGVVADFTKAGSEIFAAGNTYDLGGYRGYYGVSVSNITYNEEGYVTVTSNSTLGVRFMLKATDVTTDSVVKVNMRWREDGTNVWTRPGYGGTFTNSIDSYAGYTGIGEWMTVEFKLVDLLKANANCPEFSDGEETMYYINFFFQVGSLDIKTISIS